MYKKEKLLIEGENKKALAFLLTKYRGKIDLIYIDPPFNSGQNFYFSPDKRNSISAIPSSVVAYSDKFTLENYISFLKERLLLLRELLSERGSLYLHIDDKMSHYVKVLLDEVFGIENFKNDITRIKCNPKNFTRSAYGNEKDVILFYAKDYRQNIWNEVKIPLTKEEQDFAFQKIDASGRKYNTVPCHALGETRNGATGGLFNGIKPPAGRHWRYSPKELEELDKQGLIEWSSTGNPRIIKYADEHIGKKIQDVWVFKDPQNPDYPTQKNADMLKLIVEQSSMENSTVLDCFAGSGTAILMAEKLNRNWIGIDNSKIAIDVIRGELKNTDYTFCNLGIKNHSLEQISAKEKQISFIDII